MPWNGSGTYALPPAYSPEVNGTTIDATRYNGLTNDVATGISAALAKNGENAPTANLPMGGFKHTGAASANAAGQYLTYGQNLGTVVADAGSVGTPSYTFNGDLNNGWWAPAADTQAWSLAGAEAMRLNSTGLGLGVTPLSALHVKSGQVTPVRVESTTARGSGQVAIGLYDPTGLKAYFGYGTTNDQLFVYQGLNAALNFYTNAAEALKIAAGGAITQNGTAVGIGGSANTALTLALGTGAYLSSKGSGGQEMIAGADASGVVVGAYSNHSLFLRTNNTDRITVDTSGNVGFGVTPTSNLDITRAGASVVARIRAAAGFGAVVQIGGNGVAMGTASFDLQQDSGANVDIVNRSNTRMSFYTNGVERLRLNADGSLYGTALHNVGTPTGTTTQYIASGTYNPTTTNVANVTASSATAGWKWIRVGNVVTVCGELNTGVRTAGAATFTEIGVSLPIASNLTAVADLMGTSQSGNAADYNYGVIGDSTNDRAAVQLAAGSTTGSSIRVWFQYEVK